MSPGAPGPRNQRPVMRRPPAGQNGADPRQQSHMPPQRANDPSQNAPTKQIDISLSPVRAGDGMKNTARPKKDPTKKQLKKQKRREKRQAEEKKNRKHISAAASSLIKGVIYILVILIVSAVISTAAISFANDIFGFVKSEEPIEITIPENATLGDIAKILADSSIIKYEWLFNLYCKNKDDGKGFVAGKYSVSPLASYSEILDTFKEHKPTGISWITIPEGYTTDEIINTLVDAGIGTKEGYIDVINYYDYDFWFVKEIPENWKESGRLYRLDGYLFPDTYQFYNASSESTVIKKFLTRFNEVFTKSYKTRAEEMGYTTDQILIIASMIEKEAGRQTDFNNVSSVFHNRLNSPDVYPYLESDATIVYAIQHETGVRPNMTAEDLEYDTPYNSYKNPGLVPGPISSPSNSAILAALNPTNTYYYYFISYENNTFFSSSLEEHNMYKAEINEKKALKQNSSD